MCALWLSNAGLLTRLWALSRPSVSVSFAVVSFGIPSPESATAGNAPTRLIATVSRCTKRPIALDSLLEASRSTVNVRDVNRRRSLVFGDIGSGCGRLVVAQALTWPWRTCRGVEIVPSLNEMGEEALQAADRLAEGQTKVSSDARRLLQAMAPCSLSQGDVNDGDVSAGVSHMKVQEAPCDAIGMGAL